MPPVLLLDLDHTLYPSTLPTARAVDARITAFVERHLGLDPPAADAVRVDLCARFGTTLKGLETLYSVDREIFCDFVHAVDASELPPPNPGLRSWLRRLRCPAYVFTNARRDWAERCLQSLGVFDLVSDDAEAGALCGIFDIAFVEWTGKPQPTAFAGVERYVRGRHPGAEKLVLADDRLENLAAAKAQGWETIWVKPHDAIAAPDPGQRVVEFVTDLDPEDWP